MKRAILAAAALADILFLPARAQTGMTEQEAHAIGVNACIPRSGKMRPKDLRM